MKLRDVKDRPEHDGYLIVFYKSGQYQDFEYDFLDRSWWEYNFAQDETCKGWLYLDEICRYVQEELGK